MKRPPPVESSEVASSVERTAKSITLSPWLGALLLIASAGIPLSLLWDFSWESTVGIDLLWSPPHAANYLAVVLAGLAGIGLAFETVRRRADGIRLARWRAPLGAWMAVWGSLAFAVAVLFDRWWQSSYGLAAGIWHPPQLLKAVAFFTVILGAWMYCVARQDRLVGAFAFVAAGCVVLAMITLVTLPSTFANRQHSAPFFQIACGTYPIVLAALAISGRLCFSATIAALCYTLLIGAMVWILPLIPAQPQVAPIYNPRDHLLPPAFPLLLALPAFAIDALLRASPGRARRFGKWADACEAGVAFFVIFTVAHWLFAQFLLSPAADNWFFAGGGKQWPFFLNIHPSAKTAFWKTPGEELNFASTLITAGLAIMAARLGLGLGAWMKRVQR